MLPKYQKILLTTDLTPNSGHAFRHAVILARHSQSKIHLLHVVPEIDAGFRSYVSTVMGQGKLEELEAEHREQARAEVKKDLDEFVSKELADYPEDIMSVVSIEVLHGDPVSMILTTAQRLDVDVIVMGTHGKGFLGHAFLGSVAEKVLQKSKIPVFIIPLPD